VIINGNNFTGATAVDFGGFPATNFTVLNQWEIRATSPAQGPSITDVTVTTPLGTSSISNSDHFTYAIPPVVSSVSPVGGPTTGGSSVIITGTNLTGASAVHFGASPSMNYIVDSATQISASAPAEGAGTVDVTVTTFGGTSPTSSADQFTYETAPSITGISASVGPTAGGTSVIISGNGFTGATAVDFGGAPAHNYSVTSSSSISAVSPAAPAGTVDITVTTPVATSAPSSADQFTFQAPPSISTVGPASGPVGGETTVTITGNNLEGTTAVDFGSTAAADFTVTSPTSITAVTAPEPPGPVQVTVTTPGGTSPTSSASAFTFVLPTITSVAPGIGPTSGGTSVTIAGTGFTDITAVDFGTVPATSFTVISPTQISAVSPAHAGTPVDVTVMTPFGSTALTGADRFTYVGPYVTKVTPNAVSTGGGATVTISGSGFAGTTAVDVGGTPATTFTVLSATSITAVVPPGPSATVDVTVTATSTSPAVAGDRLKYVTPAVTKLTPTSGPANKSTTVTLNGVMLTGATAVHFGNALAVNFTVHSATSIVAVAPPQTAGSVAVTVTTAAGSTAVTSAANFTYKPTAITRVTPNSGTVAGGTPVIITGTLFAGATAVRFSGVPATSFSATATSITAIAPAHAAGTVDIQVTAAAGTSAVVTADHYTYVVPTVTKVMPASGPTAGGTTVTITGIMLHGADAVTFGSVPATSFTVLSPTQITAVAPPSAAATVDVRVTTAAGQTPTSTTDHFTYV
jgi:hypothetical protein